MSPRREPRDPARRDVPREDDPAFVTLAVRVADAAAADRLLAEAYEAGAAGCEERGEEGSGKTWVLYVAVDRAEAVGRALRAVAVDSEIGPPEPVLVRDWSEAWREGLGAVVVSPRLVVRPPFVAHPERPGQAQVVIEPGQAFGTGGHESTRLALELLDRWLPRLGHGAAVLDVGTGSGVLAVAAARLGARRAVGLDLDPLATAAAAEAARANGVADAVAVFTGGVEALGPGRFELVVANLLRRELAPILGAVLARVAPGGAAVFTGLLGSDRPRLASAFAEHGFAVVDEAERRDERGEPWIGLVVRAGGAGAG